MNDDIKNFIASYSGMTDTYRPKVSPDSEKLRAVEKYLAEVSALGEKCKDIMEFMTKVTEQDVLNKFNVLLSELAMESLKSQQPGGQGKQAKEPSVADAALGYHKAYESIAEKEKFPETCAVYERVFRIEKESSKAGEFVRRLAEEGLFVKMTSAPLIEQFRPLVAQADSLSIPVMAYHNECMLRMAEKALSSTEIEYESNRLVELNRMELTCDELLQNDLYYTLGGAVSGYLISPTEENRQRVENSYRFVAEFFGLNVTELFEIPRVRDLIEKIIIPMLNKNEGGRKFTAEQEIKESIDVVNFCVKDKEPVIFGDSSLQHAVLWGRKIPLSGYLDALRKPQRPVELMS
jgi:hypothetical protein